MIENPIATLVKARDEWFNSKEGKSCCDGSTSGEFLRNRLDCAFLAGATAGEAAAKKQLSERIGEILK
jgi:hypothetical protein